MNDILDWLGSDNALLVLGFAGIGVTIAILVRHIRDGEQRTRRMRRDQAFRRWQDQ